jgi:hypothetical protein
MRLLVVLASWHVKGSIGENGVEDPSPSNNLCGLRPALSQADREDCPSRGLVVAIAAAGYRCILHGGYLGAAQSLSSTVPTSGFACEGLGDKVDVAEFLCL